MAHDSYFIQIFSLSALGIMWAANLILLWALHREWWRIRAVRRLFWITPLVGAVLIGLWTLGAAIGVSPLISIGASLAASVLTLSVAVTLALPFSGVMLTIERLVRWILTRRSDTREMVVAPAAAPVSAIPAGSVMERPSHLRVNSSRRSFLTTAAAAFPAMTLSASTAGLVRAAGPVQMPEVPLYFPDLHPDLEGLRILHLSDIHLGYYVNLDDLEDVMRSAEGVRPDLMLISGDISDDLSMLPGALRIMSQLKPRYGAFATLGNHEYFRGIDTVVRIMDAGPIPLLRSTGAPVTVGNARLYVGGADDPVSMRQKERNHRFLQNSVNGAFDGAPSDAFHLLMSHRPEGLDVAAEEGIHLTVAGHTHGAQFGFNGRSLLEPWMPQRYLWGHYRKGSSQLYTSAGVGHWFPFRLGCPPEAPVYVLRKMGNRK